MKYQSRKNVISALKIAPLAFKTLRSIHIGCLSVRAAVFSLGCAGAPEMQPLQWLRGPAGVVLALRTCALRGL